MHGLWLDVLRGRGWIHRHCVIVPKCGMKQKQNKNNCCKCFMWAIHYGRIMARSLSYVMRGLFLQCLATPELTHCPQGFTWKTAIHESVSGKVQPNSHTCCYTCIMHHRSCLLFMLLYFRDIVSRVDCLLRKHKPSR